MICFKTKKILMYLFEHSDTFSILVKIEKPYSRMPPNFRNTNLQKNLNPYILKYYYNRDQWPVSFLTKRKHQIMAVYTISPACRKEFEKETDLFFSAENNYWEDLCFYKKGKVWFITILHEKIAYTDNCNANDLDFWRKVGIKLITN